MDPGTSCSHGLPLLVVGSSAASSSRPVVEEEEGSAISLILLDNMDKMGYKYMLAGCCPNPWSENLFRERNGIRATAHYGLHSLRREEVA